MRQFSRGLACTKNKEVGLRGLIEKGVCKKDEKEVEKFGKL